MRELTGRCFLVAKCYTIADVNMFAYTHVAADAGFDLGAYPAVSAWIDRVRQQPNFLDRIYDYNYDPHATGAL